MKKAIARTTIKAINDTLAEKKIAVNLRISLKDTKPVREPGVVGICETKKGNLMVYMVNENGRMYNTSVHTNRREANGRVLERILAAHAC